MAGGTLSWQPAGWGDLRVSLTGLYGFGSGTFAEQESWAYLKGNRDINRVDAEALIQWPVGNYGAAFQTGLRYVGLNNVAKGNDSFGNGFVLKDQVSLYLAEYGFLASTQLDDQGSFIFGGLTFGLGYRNSTSDMTCCVIGSSSNSKNSFVGSIDINAGIKYSLTPTLDWSWRWRMFVLTETVGGTGSNDTGLELGIVHGIELNMTWRFN